MSAPARVGVLGGGRMGAGIAHAFLLAGSSVTVIERDSASADAAAQRVAESIRRSVERDPGRDAAELHGRLRTGVDVSLLADADLVIEAVPEDRAMKEEALSRTEEFATTAVLASNTSSLSIDALAVGRRHPERFFGLHFFNPVPVLSLVEIIPSLLTHEDVTDRARHFVVDVLGKDPIRAPDRAGFTVNALLIPYLLSAIRMLEQGLASAKDIDDGMVKGCAHPMGPLALTDLIGLDTVLGVAETLYAEQREQLFAPPALLQRLVAAGRLGRKTGRGLYDYA